MVETRPHRNGVIITTYVESRNCKFNPIRLSSQTRVKTRGCDRLLAYARRADGKPLKKPFKPRVLETRGCDRRAQLLAYVRELRRGDGKPVKKPFKKRKWEDATGRIKRFFSRFRGGRGEWRYESIVTEDCSDGGGKWSYGRRKRRRKAHFCKKVMDWFKKISRAWKCKNGDY